MKKIALFLMGLMLVANCAFANTESISLPAELIAAKLSPTFSFTNIGIGLYDFTKNGIAPGTFYQTVAFTLDSDSDLASKIFSIDFGTFSGIEGFSAYLFDNSDSLVTFASGNFLDFSVQNLDSSFTYYLGLTGTVAENSVGLYSGALRVNPVPLPGAVLLFGSGLLGIVGLRRRQIV